MKEEMYQVCKEQLKVSLINFYKKKRNTVPLSPFFEEKETPLAGFYVMPRMVMVKQNQKTDKEERIPLNSLKDLFITRCDGQQKIYVCADAGFGKTSFSKYLAITWSQSARSDENHDFFKDEDLKALSNFEFLFLVLLRDSTTVCNIDQMIQQQIIEKLQPLKSQYPLGEILEREKCLLILDGLDEWTHPDNSCRIKNKKLPHRCARDNCVILSTTRSLKLDVYNIQESEIDKKVELVQLSPKSTFRLERNVIRKMSGVIDEDDLTRKTRNFDKVINDCSLKSMQNIPLLLIYMACLWCKDEHIGDSLTDVYINIIELLLSRTKQKHPEVHQTSKPSRKDIPEYFKKHTFCQTFYSLLKALAQLAYHILFHEKRENTLVFDRSVAEKYLKGDEMAFSLLSGILTGSTTITASERNSKVSFSHKSVQEFFAAMFVSFNGNSRKTILEKCENVESILDMSTICHFVSSMNATMICEISEGFMSVVNEDEETPKYRARTSDENFYQTPLYHIQDMLLSCLKEMPERENIQMFLQDVFIIGHIKQQLKCLSKLHKNNIKSLYISVRYTSSSLREILELSSVTDLKNLEKLYYESDGEKEAEITRLLSPCLQSLSLRWGKWTNHEENLSERLGQMGKLQYLEIKWFVFSREILERVLNFISSKKELKKVRLSGLSYNEPSRDCERMRLDLSQHSELTHVELHDLPPLQLSITSPLLIDVELSRINIGGSSLFLSPEMREIERVKVWGMTAESLQNSVNVLDQLPKLQTVNMDWCRTEPETDDERFRNFIPSSQTFNVTSVKHNKYQRSFVFQKKKTK